MRFDVQKGRIWSRSTWFFKLKIITEATKEKLIDFEEHDKKVSKKISFGQEEVKDNSKLFV